MNRPPYRTVRCRNCGEQLSEPPPRSGFTGQPHPPCPNCGSTAREYQLGFSGSIAPTGDVTILAPPATATATAPASTLSVERSVEAGTFTRTVIWSKNPDCWLAEIRDVDGDAVGVEVAYDAQDVFLLLDVHLLPPGTE